MQVDSNFESGSIGKVEFYTPYEIGLSLRDDNDNPSLPEVWRNWWYVKLTQVPTDQVLTLHLKNRGHFYHYAPVYSYDQKQWWRFDDSEVITLGPCKEDMPAQCELKMAKKFDHSTVWVARFNPYPYSRLESYLKSIKGHACLQIEDIGKSLIKEKPIHMLTITDPKVVDAQKKRVWMHARTHPGETTSSFVLEGLINYLLSDDDEVAKVRETCIFNIVPMHNPDGVIAGNYRSTPDSIDLERGWSYDSEDCSVLTSEAPQENQVLNKQMRKFLLPSKDSPAVSVALNLHTSNNQAEVKTYFFPHFGEDAKLYTAQQRALWQQQVAFINMMFINFNGRIERPPQDGGAAFLAEPFPETWWWMNRQDKVLAMTLETTYGKAGFDHWITADDLCDVGVALVNSIACYYDPTCSLSQKAMLSSEPHPDVY